MAVSNLQRKKALFHFDAKNHVGLSQGDQIGRIFANWAGFLKTTGVDQKLELIFSQRKSDVIILDQNYVEIHFG
jgi:hypothetical protein